jgi:hypothetical protein
MERVHMNDIQEIIYRVRKGESVEAIHRDTGHAKKTIRKYRKWSPWTGEAAQAVREHGGAVQGGGAGVP